MNDSHDIDARIDTALAAHVRAPRLDRQFDAAVWRRIDTAQGQPARAFAASRRSGGVTRWLRAGNAAGVVVAAVLMMYYGLQLAGDIAPDLPATVLPEPDARWLMPASWAITAVALAFGLRFTALGRWVRTEFF